MQNGARWLELAVMMSRILWSLRRFVHAKPAFTAEAGALVAPALPVMLFGPPESSIMYGMATSKKREVRSAERTFPDFGSLDRPSLFDEDGDPRNGDFDPAAGGSVMLVLIACRHSAMSPYPSEFIGDEHHAMRAAAALQNEPYDVPIDEWPT
jgi:hypothetical protein